MRFKPLPIGVDDFEKIREQGYYYADKTLLIKELLENIYTAGEAPKVVNIEEQLCSFKWKRVFEMERKRQYKSRVGKMPWNVICLKREG
ncbi:MAG TPA: AAA family ATPase [Candidatus Blautia merdipullorum]|nr:AAA family ATPase [Candidatus Blautia merdipullorum]